MPPYAFLTLEQVEERLAPFGGLFASERHKGTTVWTTGWGVSFTLTREVDGIHFDEWQVEEAIRGIIAQTQPADWAMA